MSVHVPNRFRRAVLDRANRRCEYCLIPQRYREEALQFDHVRPLKMNGRTILSNLALACRRCNEAKGPNIAAFDPVDDRPALLFSPRSDEWADHFEFRRGLLVPRTSVGRATIELLDLNALVEQVDRFRAFRAGFSFP